jgi:probable F420-dependent oxidoreductase
MEMASDARDGLLFGLDVPATSATNGVDVARGAERLGFDFVSTNDHVIGDDPRHEAWTLLTWLAASTSQVRLATRVLGVPYREPALVAKMATTLAELTHGRLILGLGAGSGEDEFEAIGLARRSLRQRISDLEEAIVVIRRLWTENRVSYEGSRYRVANATLEPKPVTPIPIWLGTAGPRGLSLVGRLADGWIPSYGHASPDEVTDMISVIDSAAYDAGRDPASIARIYNVSVSLDGVPDADVHGDADEVVEQLGTLMALGFTGFNLQPIDNDAHAVERLARSVLPGLRSHGS